jgi:hypothetical protein
MRVVRLLFLTALPMLIAGCGHGNPGVSAYWRHLAVGPGGKTLELQWTGGVGDKLDRIDTEETPRTVKITVHVHVFRGPRIAILAVYDATVHLRKPLDNRELLHGRVNYAR